MGRGSDDSEADIPVQTGFPRHEARLRRIPPPSSERIAQIVVEHGDPRQPRPGALDSLNDSSKGERAAVHPSP